MHFKWATFQMHKHVSWAVGYVNHISLKLFKKNMSAPCSATSQRVPAILLVFLLQVPEPVLSFVSSAFVLFITNRLLLSFRTAATFPSRKHARLGLVSGTCNGASFLESSSLRQIFVRLPPSHHFSSMQKRRLRFL